LAEALITGKERDAGRREAIEGNPADNALMVYQDSILWLDKETEWYSITDPAGT